jgi:ABC-type Fe3+-hydroxamate transport system substrate-binding protein
MNWCGLMNVARKEDRYPETSLEQLRSSDLEIILLSSEPYPFKEKDVEEIEGITNKKVIRTDGEIWSWYGSRMLRIADYVKELKKKI